MSKILKPGSPGAAPAHTSATGNNIADKRFKKLIENSYEGITLFDRNLNVIYRSSSAKLITGWETRGKGKKTLIEQVHPEDGWQVSSIVKDVFRYPGKPVNGTLRLKHFKGHYIWLECIFTNYLDDPDIDAIVCNFREITQQKQAEELQHQTIVELYAYKFALDESAIVAITDQKGIINYVNDQFCKISGYSRQELLGQDHRIINSGYHDKAFIRDMWVAIANGHTWKGEFKNKAKDGSYYWVDATIVPFLDDRGKPYKYIGIRFDITEKKKNEAVLTESEKKYKHLFENNPLPLLIWDFETLQIIDCNTEAILKYGYSREEFLNLTIKDIRPVEDVPLIEKLVRDELTYGEIHRRIWRHKKKNGEIMFMNITGHLMDYNGRRVSLALSHDITESLYYIELDKLEKNLLEMNAEGSKSLAEEMGIYLKGIESLHTGMICSIQLLKDQKLYNMASPTLPKEYLEAIEGAAIGANAGSCGTSAFLKQEVIVSDIANDIRWADYKEIAGRYDLKACWSHPIIDGNGIVMATFACYYREIKTPAEREENTVQRAVNILQVILESSRREQALNASNARFETATEATDDIIWDWDLETGAVYYSQNLKKLFGHPGGLNRDNLPFYIANVHPDDLDRVLLDPHDVRYGTMKNWTEEYRFKKANGEYSVIRDRAIVIRDENGLGVRMIGAMQNITKEKKEEQRLKLLESVIINTNDSVIITEAEPFEQQGRRILYVNDAFTKMTGYSADEVIGKSPRLLQGPKSDQAELERLTESLRQWQPCEGTIINYKKNGDEFWSNFSVTPVADEKGWFTHWISVEHDVTEQKKNERALLEAYQERNTILESIDDAFFAVDKNWVVSYWNSKAEEVLVTPRDKILNQNLWEVFSGSIGSESYKRYHEAVETNQAAHFEDFFQPLDRWFEISAYPSEVGLSVYFKDITQRKTSEMRLKELNESLQTQTKELAISNAELEQFAYVASHDLQEPLRMVTSFLSQLEKKYSDVIDDKGRQYIHFAVDGAKRMRQIILDLLDFSRVGRIEEDLEDVDFNKLMSEILALYRRQIEELSAKISFEELPIVQTYKTPLRQVFQNLIGNSLKYHTRNGVPKISISCKETKTHFQFSVEDNGIGIAPEYFEKIFIIFQRLHNKDEYSGTGMGLAIAKKIVENLGGKIWLKSSEGKGSTFYFTLLKK